MFFAGCQLPDPHPSSQPAFSAPVAADVIRAEVPEGFGGVPSLGVPLGANFEPLIGGGGSLLPQSGGPQCGPYTDISSYRDIVRTNKELSANAHAWFVDASARLSRENSFAYQAFEITAGGHLDESTPMVRLPADARTTPSRFCSGTPTRW